MKELTLVEPIGAGEHFGMEFKGAASKAISFPLKPRDEELLTRTPEEEAGDLGPAHGCYAYPKLEFAGEPEIQRACSFLSLLDGDVLSRLLRPHLPPSLPQLIEA